MSLTHDGEGRIRLLWRILLFLGTTLAVMTVAGLVLPLEGITGASAATLLGALVAGWILLGMEGRGPGALGFHLAPSVPREALVGFGLGLAVAVVVAAGLALLGGARWSGEEGTLGGWVAGAVAAAAFLALPAAAEEALLRGYPLQALAERWGGGWALVATSALFGALHATNPGASAMAVTNTAAAGLFLGAVVLRTGSLWWGTGAHLGWNWGLGYLADLPVSGLEVADAPWVRGGAEGPAWLGGGAFGPEGSVVATAAFLAAAGLCWWGPWLRREGAADERRPLWAGSGRDERTSAPRAPENDKEHEP